MKVFSQLGVWFLVSLLSSITASTGLFGEALTVGATAPAIVVTTDEGKSLDLAKIYKAGPTLVYFYPKADTPGCTRQACNLRDNFTSLSDAGVTVIGASMDNVQAQARFKEKYQLPFTLIADTDGALCDGFGVAKIANKIPARQSFLVIDGKVAWRDLHAKPATQTQDALAALKASKEASQ